MKTHHQLFKLFLLIVVFVGCQPTNSNDQIGRHERNRTLQNTLDSMAVIDQMPYKLLTSSENLNRDSIYDLQTNIFISNCLLAQDILDEYGYPGFDLVGEESSKNYWLIVQHCDTFPDFQEKVLAEMKKHVDLKNASGRNYAYLTDRVRINANQPQRYGTQVRYDLDEGVALPKNLEDPENVNARRLAIGMESLEEYLDLVTTQHREMNRGRYEKMGILAPKEKE